MEITREYSAPDEIEIEDDLDEVENAEDQDWDLLESIMGRYNQILTDEIELKSQGSLVQEEQANYAQEKQRIIKKNEDKKAELMEYFGEEKFNEFYSVLIYFRQQENQGDEFQKQQYEAMKKLVGGNKYDLTQLFILDGIVFKEMLNQNLNSRH